MADFDAVVIGSGAGGLAAALALSQAGWKVLVLEQHYLPGGWCHSFHLEGFRFSPGVHYLGELQPGGRMRALYEGLGVSEDLSFFELNPKGFEHVTIGTERFDIPAGKAAMVDALARRFPSERKGIAKYLDAVDSLAGELDVLGEIRGVRDVLALPLRAPTFLRFGLRSAKAMIAAYVHDPLLKNVLSAQCGDHGLPPSMAPAPIHAAIAAHYLHGGYYPRGGGGAIPRAFVRALRRAGGEIRVRAPVDRILIEGRRAIGVRLADGTEIRARHVISNADPHVTFDRLVGREHLSPRVQRKLSRTKFSVSALSLFLATDLDLRGAGIDSGNYWVFPGSVDEAYRRSLEPWGPEVAELPGLFVTASTLKDPTKPKGPKANGREAHTLEAFALVGYDAFSKWAHTRHGDRPEGYASLKRELTERMVDAVNRVVPGVRDHLLLADLGTPLTNEHYCEATRGNLYGTEKTLGQLGPFGWQPRTEIEGLTLCGASTVAHGVMGATVSGLFAAKGILRCRIADLLGRKGPELRTWPADDPSGWPEEIRPKPPAGSKEAASAA